MIQSYEHEQDVRLHKRQRVSSAACWYTTGMKPPDLDPVELGWEIDGTGYLSDHVEQHLLCLRSLPDTQM